MGENGSIFGAVNVMEDGTMKDDGQENMSFINIAECCPRVMNWGIGCL